MPKKIIEESILCQFFRHATQKKYHSYATRSENWILFLDNLNIKRVPGGVVFYHILKNEINTKIEYKYLKYYKFKKNNDSGNSTLINETDEKNKEYMILKIDELAEKAGYSEIKTNDNHKKEKEFHDRWAQNEDPNNIDVFQMCEACTSPEIRYIIKKISPISSKKILEVGCGLGENSVYLALNGAIVTSVDISHEMIEKTKALAKKYNVKLKAITVNADYFILDNSEQFDVIFMGNLLHHVNIEKTISKIFPYLKKGGLFISWDPIAYNPIINLYRKIASDVRTDDEHPLKKNDIEILINKFNQYETKFFWFTTLLLFLYMFIIQRVNPNKERYWKKIVKDANKWNRYYYFFEKIDRYLLQRFNFLRWYCWNVVFIGKK